MGIVDFRAGRGVQTLGEFSGSRSFSDACFGNETHLGAVDARIPRVWVCCFLAAPHDGSGQCFRLGETFSLPSVVARASFVWRGWLAFLRTMVVHHCGDFCYSLWLAPFPPTALVGEGSDTSPPQFAGTTELEYGGTVGKESGYLARTSQGFSLTWRPAAVLFAVPTLAIHTPFLARTGITSSSPVCAAPIFARLASYISLQRGHVDCCAVVGLHLKYLGAGSSFRLAARRPRSWHLPNMGNCPYS